MITERGYYQTDYEALDEWLDTLDEWLAVECDCRTLCELWQAAMDENFYHFIPPLPYSNFQERVQTYPADNGKRPKTLRLVTPTPESVAFENMFQFDPVFGTDPEVKPFDD